MIIKAKNLSHFPYILHGFTTRELGSDYEHIGREIGVPATSFRTLNQIHSNRVITFPSPLPSPTRGLGNNIFPPPLMGGGEGEGDLEGDALITNTPGIFVGIRTADCVPLLAYDPEHKAVAAIHAGWKGILVGIIENSIKEMREKFRTDPKNIVLAVGPTLCPGCFEIGPEVANEFRTKFGERLTISPSATGTYFLDLQKAVELILTDHGVLPKNIEFYPQCNKCREELFFSFRRGNEKERQLSFIGLTY